MAESVLGPAAGPILQSALLQGSQRFVLRDASLAPTSVRAVVCAVAGPADCHKLRLTRPGPSCASHQTGPWCLAWEGTPPGFAGAVEAALAQSPDPWSQPVRSAAPPVASDLLLEATAIAVLAPLILGLLIGALLRLGLRRRLRGARRAVAIPLLSTLGTVAAGFATAHFGFGDHVFGGFLAGCVALVVAHELAAERRQLTLGALCALVGLGAVEAASHLLSTPPPGFPPLAELTTTLDPQARARAHVRRFALSSELLCAALGGGLAQMDGARLQLPDGTQPRVLHLGDSMTYGSFVGPHETFVAALSRMEPHVVHLNGGLPGTSIDAQLALARQNLPRIKPNRVVVHYFAGNDLDELERTYACCGDGTLFAPGSDPPQQRCPPFVWTSPRSMARWYLTHSPPPLLLRLATPQSFAARRLAGLWVRAASTASGEQELSGEAALARYQVVLGALVAEARAYGADTVLAAMPLRGAAPDAPALGWAADIAARAGVPFVSAPPELLGVAAGATGVGNYVDDPERDVHLGAAGHVRYAEWLHGHLPPL